MSKRKTQRRNIVTPCCGRKMKCCFERGVTSARYKCSCGKIFWLVFRGGSGGKTGRLVSKKLYDKKGIG